MEDELHGEKRTEEMEKSKEECEEVRGTGDKATLEKAKAENDDGYHAALWTSDAQR